MNKILFVLFFLGFSIFGHAQNSITGKIQNIENEPLYGVEVYAPDLHIGTTTDENGVYELNNLPNGEIRIVITYIGFKEVHKTINLTNNQLNFDVVLEEAIFTIDEILISTPFNKLQSDNVMKVEFAKVKSLKQKGVATLIEGLETFAGVSQISTGTSIGKPVIRGLSGNRVLVYAQGVRLENQQFGDEHGLGINEAGIESVEIIKGPASLLYGSDALGGVIYFNPEKFAYDDTFEGDFGQQYFSNTRGTNTTIGFKKSFEQWKFLVRGAYNEHLDYETPEIERVTNTRYNEINFNSGLRFNNKLISSELRYNYNKSNLGLTEGIEEQSTSKRLEEPYQEIDNHILSLHNHVFLENSTLDIDFGYIFNDRNEFEHHEDGNEEEGPALRMKLKTYNYDVKYNFPKFKNTEIILGTQGMHQTNKNLGEEILIPDARIDDLGLFATSVIDFEKSSLQGGIRYDTRKIETSYHEVSHENEVHIFESIDKNFSNFTASLGYKFDFNENITTRVNLATGFRSPNLAELTSNGVHHGTNRFEIGNNNLNNEQNLQVDIAVEYKNEHLELFVNGFYNKLNDYIYLTPTGEIEDGAEVYNYTQENAKLYGGEIGFHLHPHPIDWLHLETTFETVIGKQDNGDFLPLIPANKLSATLKTEFNLKKWLTNGYSAFTVSNTFSQKIVSDFETTSDGYTVANFGLGGDLKINNFKFELSLNANNLFDKSYIPHLSRLKNDNINAIGRNIVVGINFNL
ncbi:MAG: TonB-dependent receptor [Lutibacter sp.]|nr:MAG: TonB-dependent receptor [Lutibacter sp.]